MSELKTISIVRIKKNVFSNFVKYSYQLHLNFEKGEGKHSVFKTEKIDTYTSIIYLKTQFTLIFNIKRLIINQF